MPDDPISNPGGLLFNAAILLEIAAEMLDAAEHRLEAQLDEICQPPDPDFAVFSARWHTLRAREYVGEAITEVPAEHGAAAIEALYMHQAKVYRNMANRSEQLGDLGEM